MQQSDSYRALRRETRISLADAAPLPAPLTLYLEPTNICNFKCTYCPVHLEDYLKRSGGTGKLTIESCRHVYEQILSIGRLRTLNLYMLGEPYANRELTDFIALAKSMNVADRVIVTTNATLIDEAAAQRTISSGLDYLRISVYGDTSEHMRAVTGSKIPLERIVENVTRLKRLRDESGRKLPFIYVKMIDSADEARNRKFLDIFGPICDEVAIEPVMNWNVSRDEIDFAASPKDAMHVATRSACPFPIYTLVVNSDLSVTVCCVDWEKATRVGDLRTQSLKEIWQGAALREFRLTHLSGRRQDLTGCRSCTYLHTTPDSVDALTPQEFIRRSAAQH